TLLVCHRVRLLPGRDAGHLDPGQRLAVTLALVVAGLVLELVDPDLRTLGVCDDLAGHRDTRQRGGVGDDVGTVDDQYRGQRDRVAGRADELLDLDHVARGDLVLLAAGLDDRVHRRRTPVLSGWLVDHGRAALPDKALPTKGAQQPGARSAPNAKLTSSPPPASNRSGETDGRPQTPGQPGSWTPVPPAGGKNVQDPGAGTAPGAARRAPRRRPGAPTAPTAGTTAGSAGAPRSAPARRHRRPHRRHRRRRTPARCRCPPPR